MKKSRGFTVLELTITMSIVTIILVAMLMGLNNVTKRARDAQRLADMQAIRQALEMFYRDNGRYPGITHEGIPDQGQFIGIGNNIDTFLAPYLERVPRDPIHDGVNYYYAYDPNHEGPSGTNGVVFGFRRAETNSPHHTRDTNNGTDQELNVATYNRILYPASL